MGNRVLKTENMEQVLQSRWAEFLDPVQVMRSVLTKISNTSFKTLKQQEIPQRQTKFTVTNFKIITGNEGHDNPHHFEVWVEFTAPKGAGVVIGTCTYLLSLSGSFDLKDCFGTHFVPETP